MLRWTRLTTALLVLVLWLAPMVGGVTLGLHLVDDHHADHGEMLLPDLVRAAVHGHHHEVDMAPHHGHDYVGTGSVTLVRAERMAVAVVPHAATPGFAAVELASYERPDRRGPPDPLFAIHCSLLL